MKCLSNSVVTLINKWFFGTQGCAHKTYEGETTALSETNEQCHLFMKICNYGNLLKNDWWCACDEMIN